MMPTGARVAVTGMGVVTSIGQDVVSFTEALRAGRSGIALLRQIPTDRIQIKVGAEIANHAWEAKAYAFSSDDGFARRARKTLQRAPNSVRMSFSAAAEALKQSQLLNGDVARDRIGLIVAGSNIHQHYIHENRAKFQGEPDYINPTYALSFLDTSQVGCLSEVFGIRGIGYTVGGASASGNVALYHAWQWLRHGVVDACVVVGACADYSEVELHSFSILGAACGSLNPSQACRPFDRDRAGFVIGEGSGCVVLENLSLAQKRGCVRRGELKGASLVLDGNSLANPSAEGASKAMRMALEEAGVSPEAIDYVNAHATSSVLGDETECAAISNVFQLHAKKLGVNSTKSLTGHCMYAAGVVEFIASLIQLNDGFLHPNLNLLNPLSTEIQFAGKQARPLDGKWAISNGFGFGGFNSTVVIEGNRAPSAKETESR